MSTENPRLRKVGEQLKRELAVLVHDELRDPRLGMVTVSAVRVSRDLGFARVYVTVLGSDPERTESLKALQHASRFLRKCLGRRLKLRVVPELHFVYDESLEKGMHLSDLIERAVASDSRNSARDDC